jgi:hypothetical protein
LLIHGLQDAESGKANSAKPALHRRDLYDRLWSLLPTTRIGEKLGLSRHSVIPVEWPLVTAAAVRTLQSVLSASHPILPLIAAPLMTEGRIALLNH